MARLSSILASALLLVQAVQAGASKCPSGLVPREWEGRQYGCKCYVGDSCWPKAKAWNQLKTTVEGNLQVHVPPEAACHNTFEGPLGTLNTFDADKCAEVTANYGDEQWSTDQPALNLWKYFTNNTCTVTENPSEPCTLGYYGVYVITAKKHAHIKAGVDFARTHNLRLIIRNTGHDFIGRSTGWGALIINTHSFQDIDIITSFSGPGNYDGPAVKIGAGVQGRQLVRTVAAQGLAVVTGECPTVGITGGLIGGGGHGPLTTLYGMAADQVLEFDILTVNGEYKTVNADNEPELFWALKGGGPSTYAVVLSATIRAFPELIASGADLFINTTVISDEAVFWEGVRIFHKWSNHFVDSGLYAYFEIFPGTFRTKPFVAINQTVDQLEAILAPMIAELEEAAIPHEVQLRQYETFHDLYIDRFEDEGAGAFALTGGWLFTHKDVEDHNDAIVEAFQTVISPRPDLVYQGGIIGHLFDAGHNHPVPNSATHPLWRKGTDFTIAILSVPQGASLEVKADLQDVLTNVQDAALRAAGPNGFTYVNEADPFQPNWQDHFWGDIYPELRALKKKWDPRGVLYAVSTPGTEEWEVIEYGTRLCMRID